MCGYEMLKNNPLSLCGIADVHNHHLQISVIFYISITLKKKVFYTLYILHPRVWPTIFLYPLIKRFIYSWHSQRPPKRTHTYTNNICIHLKACTLYLLFLWAHRIRAICDAVGVNDIIYYIHGGAMNIHLLLYEGIIKTDQHISSFFFSIYSYPLIIVLFFLHQTHTQTHYHIYWILFDRLCLLAAFAHVQKKYK